MADLPETTIPFIPTPTRRQVIAVRYYLGLTQKEASAKLDVGHSTLVDLERLARDPHEATRAKIGLAMIRLGIQFDSNGNLVLPP